jgi:hypothetical protein
VYPDDVRRYFSPNTAAGEIIVVLVLICFYIWILMPMRTFRIDLASYLFIFAIVSLLQSYHRLPLKAQGVRLDNFLQALKPVGTVTLILICALIAIALLSRRLIFRPEMLLRCAWFLPWGPMQQFLLQSVLHLRTGSIVRSRRLVILLTALVFSLVHFPNHYLMILSFLGGLFWCYLFTRHPNIFALGLSHAAVDLTLLTIFPPELLGNLRVGPGFWNQ